MSPFPAPTLSKQLDVGAGISIGYAGNQQAFWGAGGQSRSPGISRGNQGGASFNTGPQGPQGVPGPQGITGDEGPFGPTGPINPGSAPQGPTGKTGSAGPAGPPGPAGSAGDTGTIGQTGDQGPPGPVGNIGPTGASGPTGNPGIQGPKGSVVKNHLGIYAFACIESPSVWMLDMVPADAPLRPRFEAAVIPSSVVRFLSEDGHTDLVVAVRDGFGSWRSPVATRREMLESQRFWGREH